MGPKLQERIESIISQFLTVILGFVQQRWSISRQFRVWRISHEEDLLPAPKRVLPVSGKILVVSVDLVIKACRLNILDRQAAVYDVKGKRSRKSDFLPTRNNLANIIKE